MSGFNLAWKYVISATFRSCPGVTSKVRPLEHHALRNFILTYVAQERPDVYLDATSKTFRGVHVLSSRHPGALFAEGERQTLPAHMLKTFTRISVYLTIRWRHMESWKVRHTIVQTLFPRVRGDSGARSLAASTVVTASQPLRKDLRSSAFLSLSSLRPPSVFHPPPPSSITRLSFLISHPPSFIHHH